MYIFGVLDQCRAPIFLEGGPPVDRTCTNADRTVHALPGNLNSSIKEFLHRPSPALDPVLLVEHSEVLRGLDNRNPPIVL